MDNTAFISDLHFPYQHRDALEFLAAVKKEYKIKIWKCVGDVVDNHTSSFHEIEYGTLSAQEEYLEAVDCCAELQDIVGEGMVISLGNHCRLGERKAKSAGIPAEYLRSYNDAFGVSWKWVDKDYFRINRYMSCLMIHSMSKTTLTNAKTHSHCTVQGHHHGTFGLEYFADTEHLRWSMTVGCLIDPSSPAFNYAKGASNNRPILGMGVLIQDKPILVPMVLKKSGRWVGTL